MSYTEIYAVRPDGNIESYGEAHNAFGGAMHIWLRLGEKYHIKGSHVFDLAPLWKSIDKMSKPDQWVMASTFDQAIIPKEYLPVVVKYLQLFATTYPTPTLTEEIAILKRAMKDDNVQGICFNQTSVNANPWWISNGEKEYDEGRPYNINQDTNHWFLTPEYLQEESEG